MGRCILGGICGIIVGSIVNMALIMASWRIYPMPEGTNMYDPESMRAYIETLPTPAFLLVLAAHAGGALVGGFVAAAIGGKAHVLLGGIVGGFFLMGGIMNLFSLPSPLWFAIADLASYLPCGILGALLAPRRQEAPKPSPSQSETA